jgi:curved DNA-binding protein CbpA
VASPLLHFQNVDLTPEEGFILSRVDGTLTPQEIFKVSSLSEKDTARTLLGLLRAGIIELEGEPNRYRIQQTEKPAEEAKPSPTPESPVSPDETRAEIESLFQQFQEQDDWQVLGLDPDAELDAIKSAFQEKSFRYHPDRFGQIGDPELDKKLAYLFSRVTESFATLANRAAAKSREDNAEEAKHADAPTPESTNEADEDRGRAKSLFEQAKRAFQKKDFWQTAVLCREAIEIVGDEAAFFHLLGLALAQNRKWRMEAEQNLKTAADLDPGNPQYFDALGMLYQRDGLDSRARKMFESARAVDRAYAAADEELAARLFEDRYDA